MTGREVLTLLNEHEGADIEDILDDLPGYDETATAAARRNWAGRLAPVDVVVIGGTTYYLLPWHGWVTKR